MKNRSLKDYIFIGLKGVVMGAADVIPGVSGGTIAFISGIYEEFINSLKSIDLKAFKILFKGRFKDFWLHINGSFLMPLFLGIGISVVSLAKIIGFILKEYPVLIWAFFFGLILASAIFIAKRIKKWNFISVISLFIGIVIALMITLANPAKFSNELWFVFLCGTIAICAMILPGISGSFILLLMGKYRFILDAISNFNIKVILTFIIGCVCGLISFSHILSWMFKKFHDITIALLTGFMFGSLNHVWPWKEVIKTRINSHGEKVPFIQKSISPFDYSSEKHIGLAIFICLLGVIIIYFAGRLEEKNN